jgi:hypothetical protein
LRFHAHRRPGFQQDFCHSALGYDDTARLFDGGNNGLRDRLCAAHGIPASLEIMAHNRTMNAKTTFRLGARAITTTSENLDVIQFTILRLKLQYKLALLHKEELRMS